MNLFFTGVAADGWKPCCIACWSLATGPHGWRGRIGVLLRKGSMAEHMSAGSLLREAGAIFDAAENGLARRARFAWRTGFDSGGRWMCEALATLRGETATMPVTNLSALGMIKYGMAIVASLMATVMILWRQQYWALPLGVFVFYAVEAQMVFLFPLAIDGRTRVFRESLAWTSRAGGTWRVMCIVLPIAGTMLFGGLAGRGFIRSWCVGCLAVVVWYEHLRQKKAGAQIGRAHV